MLKTWLRGAGLFFVVILFVGLAGCTKAEKEPYRPIASPLISDELLKAADLSLVWQTELPIKAKENIAELYFANGQLYALSDRNYMVAMDGENGHPIFSKPLAARDIPVLGLELYNDKLISIIANEIAEIDIRTGEVDIASRIGFNAEAPAARNSRLYYIPGTDSRIHVLRADDKVQLFEVAARNDSPITSVIADDQSVIFATDMGNVVCIRPDAPARLWQFDAAGAITGKIVKDGDFLYIASKDTNVYKLDAKNGKLVWKCQLQAMLDCGPVVTEKFVYQVVRDKGLTAIDKATGDVLWYVPKGLGLLSEAGRNAYIMTEDGRLVVMNNARAKEVYSVNFSQVQKFVTNLEDSKIYVADKFSRVACLKPAE